MSAPSAAELAGVAASHRRTVSLWTADPDLPHAPIDDLSDYLIDGSVTLGPDGRRTLTCSLLYGTLTAPFAVGSVVRRTRLIGVQVSDTALLGGAGMGGPVGTFVVTEPTVTNSPEGRIVSISGSDRLVLAERAVLAAPLTLTAGMSLGAAFQALYDAAGMGASAPIVAAGARTIIANVTFEAGTNVLAAMREFAKAYGLRIYADPQGLVHLTKWGDLSVVPVMTLSTSAEPFLVLSETHSWADNEGANHAVAYGNAADLTSEVKGEASDAFSIATIGERLDEFESPLVRDVGQAAAAASAMLFLNPAAPEYFDFSILPVSKLEHFDPITVTDGEGATYFVVAYTLPLGLGPMTLRARKRVV